MFILNVLIVISNQLLNTANDKDFNTGYHITFINFLSAPTSVCNFFGSFTVFFFCHICPDDEFCYSKCIDILHLFIFSDYLDVLTCVITNCIDIENVYY